MAQGQPATMLTVACPYCGEPAVFVDSAEVYHGRSYGMIYLCRPCAAWVRVHEETQAPRGRLANAELRAWKKAAHEAFAPFWQATIKRKRCTQQAARDAGYRWLAAQLGLAVEGCDIGRFDLDICKRVVAVCAKLTTIPVTSLES